MNRDLNKIFDKYYSALCIYGCRFGSIETAEDGVMQSFCALHKYIDKLKEESEVIRWLYKSVHNYVMNENKKEKTRNKPFFRLTYYDDEILTVEQERIRAEVLRMMAEAIEKLPVGRRVVIKKLFYDGLTTEQAAAQLQVSVNTIRNQKMKALEYLRFLLQDKVFS